MYVQRGRRKTRPASPNKTMQAVQAHTHATKQGYAMRSQTKNPKPTHEAQSRPRVHMIAYQWHVQRGQTQHAMPMPDPSRSN
jgi:hypothetical protein